ncbi:hypothetical protein CLOSTMETH_03936 [[Clostridium] methylpentosum DSM 5476]|uniref:Uncharacterized protein n=1 Tax=[Clostridium] methylpentosum DSM 5476 TaxID=537013 RepID=C0EJ83_9FIRM|nr:hypothetical protein CLOSTMETH_03936 [[Clostridium] methylpentosum DSM 5476]
MKKIFSAFGSWNRILVPLKKITIRNEYIVIRLLSFWYFCAVVRPHFHFTKRSFSFLWIAKAFPEPRHTLYKKVATSCISLAAT